MNNLYAVQRVRSTDLTHHGIKGQKWGKRNGPPYPLSGGDYSASERKHLYKHRKLKSNSDFNKKHFDTTISAKHETLTTLSYDPDRTKNVDMFYAAHNKLDKHQYNTLFNMPIPKTIYDDNGKKIGTDYAFKYSINNKLMRDAKIASEDSSIEEFKKLYSGDRDFYNFVTDKNRMRNYFVDDKYKFRGYRESRNVLEKIDRGSNISEKDVAKLYRMFNYVLPYDGLGNNWQKNDVARQRAKFFKAMGQAGYDGILDTNDALYGAFKAKDPVIVFNQSIIMPASVKQTSIRDKEISALVFAGRKALGL